MQIIVHAGMHKTGSSFIQKLFFDNYEQLLEQGILFPKTGFENCEVKGGRKGTTSGHNEILNVLFSNSENRNNFLSQLEQEINKHKPHTIFISCENITHHLLGNTASLVTELFAQFGQLKFVFTLREPVSWALSYYKEITSNGWGFEERDFSAFLKANNDFLNLSNTVENFSSVVGRQNVDLIIYGKELKQRGIESVICEYLNIDSKLLKVEFDKTNLSSSDVFVEACRDFNKKVYPNSVSRNAQNKILQSAEISDAHYNLIKQDDIVYIKDCNKIEELFNLGNLKFGSIDELNETDIKVDKDKFNNEDLKVHLTTLMLQEYSKNRDNLTFKESFLGVIRKLISKLPSQYQIFCKRLWLRF